MARPKKNKDKDTESIAEFDRFFYNDEHDVEEVLKEINYQERKVYDFSRDYTAFDW